MKTTAPRLRYGHRSERLARNNQSIGYASLYSAALTDGFLTPGEFTIYAEAPAATLMKTGAVIPGADGEIAVYQKFWTDENLTRTTPAVLTYADLMDTANGRCIEAAQKIKENELKHLL